MVMMMVYTDRTIYYLARSGLVQVHQARFRSGHLLSDQAGPGQSDFSFFIFLVFVCVSVHICILPRTT